MDIDWDTFLTAVYCIVDDIYQERYAGQKPERPGSEPEMSDSEVLTLEIVGQWQPRRSERGLLRYARAHWRSYFPRLLSQSAFNRRVRDLHGVLAGLGPEVSRRWPAAWGGSGSFEVLDGVAVPVARRCRVRRGYRGRRPLAGTAAFGRGGSDRDWYYGVELLLAVRSNGPISGFLLAPADCGERWLAEALLRWRACPAAPPPTADELAAVLGPTHQRGGKRQGPTGPLRPRAGVGPLARVPYLADLGFAGATWGRHWLTAWGAVVLTKALFADHPDDHARQQLTHTLCSARQIVETVNGWLEEHLGLHFPRARTDSGLLARLGAKIAAFNIVLWINRTFGRPLLAACGPFS